MFIRLWCQSYKNENTNQTKFNWGWVPQKFNVNRKTINIQHYLQHQLWNCSLPLKTIKCNEDELLNSKLDRISIFKTGPNLIIGNLFKFKVCCVVGVETGVSVIGASESGPLRHRKPRIVTLVTSLFSYPITS